MKTIDLQAMADLDQEKMPESTFDIASVLLDPKIMVQPEKFVQEIVETLDEIADPNVIPVLVQALALWPQYRGLIGPLKGRLQNRAAALRKQTENARRPAKPGKSIKWVAVGGGHLALGGRPGPNRIPHFPTIGCTHLLTLQGEKENAFQIRDATLEAGLEWIWLPMIDGNPLSAKREREVTDLYRGLSSILDAQGKIYIHCAAGIHRTGMIAYGFLRFIGFEARTARETLLDLREVTSRSVGEHRLSWGDRFSKS